ncbi:MAG: carbamoyltransferase HypF [Actinobacteria bacterium]|nr:carbamoyltransferase HypF [Actinomycetota bacterium]
MENEESKDAAGCVVVGIGNPLHGDDGVGVRALEYLRGSLPDGVELVEGMIYGPDLLPFLEGRGKAIFIDAIDAGEEPGAVFRFSPREVRQEHGAPSLSLHDFGLYELIAAAELLGQCPEEVTVIAVQVKSLEVGTELSPEVEAALPHVRRLVLEELGKANGASRAFVEIEVTGIVQGVGFRPFVYRIARERGLEGWVINTPEGARIRAAGGREALASFMRALKEEAPPAAVIEEIEAEEVSPFEAEDFRIEESCVEGDRVTLVSPDLATCGDCLRELFDPADRRYRYPFINCTNCGPRFTIIADTPYDRPLTTMASFRMCEECEREYHDPSDRRFHAQPNACPACGPRLWLEDGSGEAVEGDAVREAARLLHEGKIVAVKGLGGFQLACDATSDAAVSRLRERKRRYAKPLAVMVRDLEEARRYCRVSPEEAEMLSSPRSPIVLLEEREDSPLSRELAAGLRRQGVFLPYTPLHHLLLREAGIPLVMTSGNMSEEPIARENEEARDRLCGVADGFLLHDRDILVRYDDSVCMALRGREYPIRRARGYAPYPVILAREWGTQVLALGAELKNTFCFLRGRHAFVGQHVGDLDDRETLRHYEEAMEAVRRLFSLRPEVVAHDLHPDYLTTHLAGEFGLPAEGVQHHHAHVASCMADNDLEGRVLGVSWDGTGYGPDGTVWGGEFLLCEGAEYERVAHLRTYPMPGGDACMKDIFRMAFGVLWEVCGDGEEAVDIFSRLFPDLAEAAPALAAQVKSGLNTPLTSSAGRMFDAAAALAGLRERAFYEGQAACELEAAAAGGMDPYPWELDTSSFPWKLDTRPVFRALLDDLSRGVGTGEIAGRFHASLAEAAAAVCAGLARETGAERVVLSGGVFQNALLAGAVVAGLEAMGMACYLHRRVPCNDGGISLGQAVVAARRREAKT